MSQTYLGEPIPIAQPGTDQPVLLGAMAYAGLKEVFVVLVLIGVRSTVLALAASDLSELEVSELMARNFLNELDDDILEINYNTTLQSWNYETNITDDTLDMRNDAVDDQGRFLKVMFGGGISNPPDYIT